FTQVVGTILALARRNTDTWSGVKGSRDIPVIGEISVVEPEPVKASVPLLVEKFREGAAEQVRSWNEVFSAATRGYIAAKTAAAGHAKAVDGRVWAKAVYEVVAAAKDRDDTAGPLLPRHPVPLGVRAPGERIDADPAVREP